MYEDVKKNIRIVIYSKHKDILNKVAKNLEKDEFKIEIYNDLEELISVLKRRKIKILIYLFDSEDEIKDISDINKNTRIISYSNKKIDIDLIKLEVIYTTKLLEKDEKIDFQKYKLEIVGNLVESISHKVQSNLLVFSASQDIIKMINEDLKDNQKNDILDNLYSKNDIALQKSNTLLQLISNVTSLSSESIMHCDEIEEIIRVIVDEYLKQKDVVLSIEKKIKVGAYICGSLNDTIFVICRIIKLLIDEGKEQINLSMYEDETDWYFTLNYNEKIQDEEFIEQIRKFVVYIKNVKPKIGETQITLIMKKCTI